MQVLFYGFDMSRMLKGLLDEEIWERGYTHMYETIIQTQCIK